MKILLAFDGSPSAVRAVDYVAGSLARAVDRASTVDLVNIQSAALGVAGLLSRDAADVAEDLVKACLEAGKKLLAVPEQTLAAAALEVSSFVLIGDPATEIAAHARNHGADAVVMGTRGRGAVGGLVLGSVATKVVHLVDVPVTLVK